jgi:hypothetical protein
VAKKSKKQHKPSDKSKPAGKSERVERASPRAFGKLNYLGLLLGLIVLGLGYLFLASGSITLAPILLVFGYCVILPVAIIIDSDKWMSKLSSSAKEKTVTESAGP